MIQYGTGGEAGIPVIASSASTFAAAYSVVSVSSAGVTTDAVGDAHAGAEVLAENGRRGWPDEGESEDMEKNPKREKEVVSGDHIECLRENAMMIGLVWCGGFEWMGLDLGIWEERP